MDEINATDQKKINTAIDLCVLLAVEDIALKEGKRFEEVLPAFVCSKTGELLYDAKSRLWWSSPIEISEMYLAERDI